MGEKKFHEQNLDSGIWTSTINDKIKRIQAFIEIQPSPKNIMATQQPSKISLEIPSATTARAPT